jgi:hypothetical protein
MVLSRMVALVLVGRRIWLNMTTLNALMRTSMRILAFNVPQVKRKIFTLAECMGVNSFSSRDVQRSSRREGD